MRLSLIFIVIAALLLVAKASENESLCSTCRLQCSGFKRVQDKKTCQTACDMTCAYFASTDNARLLSAESSSVPKLCGFCHFGCDSLASKKDQPRCKTHCNFICGAAKSEPNVLADGAKKKSVAEECTSKCKAIARFELRERCFAGCGQLSLATAIETKFTDYKSNEKFGRELCETCNSNCNFVNVPFRQRCQQACSVMCTLTPINRNVFAATSKANKFNKDTWCKRCKSSCTRGEAHKTRNKYALLYQNRDSAKCKEACDFVCRYAPMEDLDMKSNFEGKCQVCRVGCSRVLRRSPMALKQCFNGCSAVCA